MRSCVSTHCMATQQHHLLPAERHLCGWGVKGLNAPASMPPCYSQTASNATLSMMVPPEIKPPRTAARREGRQPVHMQLTARQETSRFIFIIWRSRLYLERCCSCEVSQPGGASPRTTQLRVTRAARGAPRCCPSGRWQSPSPRCCSRYLSSH